MKRRATTVVILIVFLSIFGIVFAESNPWLQYYTNNSWFSMQAAEETLIPDGLSTREAEIYRAGYANGHYDALHPAFVEGLYVINTKTKKFHLSNCMTTLMIETENRKHVTDKTPEELMEQEGYKPCGNCHPERPVTQ